MPLELFTARPWDEYVDEMANDVIYGDEITLRCVSNLFNVQITIISTLGMVVEFLPENSIPIGRIILGYFAEGQGDHYVCLEQMDAQHGDEMDAQHGD